MMDWLMGLPRPVLIVGVFALGLFLIMQLQAPHSVCDSQLEYFQEAQAGYIFPKEVKKVKHPPAYEKALANCKLGMASIGACFEYYQILKKLVADLRNVSDECGPPFMEVPELKRALNESIKLMVTVAWGEDPPEKGDRSTGNLELPEQSLFCQLEQYYKTLASPEDWENLKTATLSALPGEARKIETTQDGKRLCLNCDSIKPALQAFGSREEVYARSLFSLRCDLLR